MPERKKERENNLKVIHSKNAILPLFVECGLYRLYLSMLNGRNSSISESFSFLLDSTKNSSRDFFSSATEAWQEYFSSTNLQS